MCSKKKTWALVLSKIKRLLESIFSSGRFVILLARRIPQSNKERRGKFLRAHRISLLEESSHLSVCPLGTSIDNQQNQSLQGLESGFSFLGKAAAYFLRLWWSSRKSRNLSLLKETLRDLQDRPIYYPTSTQLWFRNKAVHPCSVYVTNNFQKLRPTPSNHLFNS